jgi:hypothetical protein
LRKVGISTLRVVVFLRLSADVRAFFIGPYPSQDVPKPIECLLRHRCHGGRKKSRAVAAIDSAAPKSTAQGPRLPWGRAGWSKFEHTLCSIITGRLQATERERQCDDIESSLCLAMESWVSIANHTVMKASRPTSNDMVQVLDWKPRSSPLYLCWAAPC